MKRGVYMLAALLAVLIGASSGVLYYTGYWDTWADKKGVYVVEIRDSLDPRAPQKARQLFSECAATQLLDLAEKAGCKPEDGPVAPQVVACLKPTHAQEAAMALMGCVVQVQAAMAQDAVVK